MALWYAKVASLDAVISPIRALRITITACGAVVQKYLCVCRTIY
jgi:hypothetical protein